MLFKFDGVIDGKDLAKFMWFMGSNMKVYDMKVVPVVNARPQRNGALAAKSDGTIKGMLLAWIKETQVAEFTTQDAAGAISKESKHLTPVLAELIKEKRIKRLKRAHYKVLK